MLADLVDVAVALGLGSETELSAAQVQRAPGLLASATALFQAEAGRRFVPGTYVQRMRVGVGGRLRLVETPVAGVESVVDDDGGLVAFSRDGAWLRVDRHLAGSFVTVTYSGGEIPASVRSAVANMVARALVFTDPETINLSSHEVSSGPFRERKQFSDWADRFGNATGGGGMFLSDDDKALARSFRWPAAGLVVMEP